MLIMRTATRIGMVTVEGVHEAGGEESARASIGMHVACSGSYWWAALVAAANWRLRLVALEVYRALMA